MGKKRKSRSVQATPRGIKRLEEAKANGRNELEPFTYERIAERAKIAARSVQRFFGGENVDRDTAIAILQVLGLSVDEVLSIEELLIEDASEKIENQSTESPERAGQLVEGLKEALYKFQKRQTISLGAMDWLKANRLSLSKESAQSALKKFPDKMFSDNETENFSNDIRKYLQIVHSCVEEGDSKVIDIAMSESIMPINEDYQLYIEALKFIKDRKINKSLPSAEAREIEYFLEYLIRMLPVYSLKQE